MGESPDEDRVASVVPYILAVIADGGSRVSERWPSIPLWEPALLESFLAPKLLESRLSKVGVDPSEVEGLWRFG